MSRKFYNIPRIHDFLIQYVCVIRIEHWNAGILGVKAEVKHFNCKKLLSFNFVHHKLTHYSIIPMFHHSNCDPPVCSLCRLVFLDRQGEANSIELYGSFSTATPRSGTVSLAGRQSTACGISGSGHSVFIGTGQGGMSGKKFFQVMAAAGFASGTLIRICNKKFTGFSTVHTQKIKKGHGYSP